MVAIEDIDQNDQIVPVHFTCLNSGSTSSNLMYLQTFPKQHMIFCDENNVSVVLKPETLAGIEVVHKKSIKFVTTSHDSYEVKFKKKYHKSSYIVMEVALWLRSTYGLSLNVT